MTPYARAGYAVTFPVADLQSAELRIVRHDGSPVPAGARVRLAGVAQTFRAGRDGKTFLQGLKTSSA